MTKKKYIKTYEQKRPGALLLSVSNDYDGATGSWARSFELGRRKDGWSLRLRRSRSCRKRGRFRDQKPRTILRGPFPTQKSIELPHHVFRRIEQHAK